MNKYELKYGEKHVDVLIPKQNLLGVLEKKGMDKKLSEEEIIVNALDNPINSSKIEEIVKPNDKICIIISDITRSWQRMNVFLPYIIDRLVKSGVKEEDIIFLCATGSHRAQSTEEHRILLGDGIFGRFKIVDHDSTEKGNHIYLGKTSYGTPVSINKIAMESDHIILTGAVVFHDLAGWGGGKKSILPGIAAYESIMANHSLSLNPELGSGIHPNVRSGNIEDNPIHQDMLEAGKMVNPSFLLNVIIDEEGLIGDAVAGHYINAHDVGRNKVTKLNALEIKEKGDMVIVSTGGYPKDIDLYQSTKALINAKDAVVKGGSIILLCQCSEGIGHSDMEEIILKHHNILDREKEVRRRYTVSKFIGYLTNEIAKEYDILMVSDLSKDLLEKINIRGVESVEKALEIVYGEKGYGLKTYVIPQGSDILPVLKS